MAVKRTERPISARLTGHQPNRDMAAPNDNSPVSMIIHSTTKETIMQDPETARMRARITDGASRLRVGVGRVVRDR